MPGELIQLALDPLLTQSGFPQASELTDGAMNIGQQGYNGVKDLLIAGFGIYVVGSHLMRRGHHEAGGHTKPAEVREARARVVQPWESGLQLEDGTFYEPVPLTDLEGNQVFINGEPQLTKKFHKLIEPGLNGLGNLLRPTHKLVIVNNIPEKVDFLPFNVRAGDALYNLTGGFTFAHVKARDEFRRPMVYEYREPSPDGKRLAGRICVEQALLNAIMTAPNRADTAGQLEQISRPEVQKRLEGETDIHAVINDPEFSNEIEKAVHDRFLERGSVFVHIGVTPKESEDKAAADVIAAAMRARNKIFEGRSQRISIGQDINEDDETAATATNRLKRSRLDSAGA